MFVEHHSIGIGVSPKRIAVVGVQTYTIVAQREILHASSHTCYLRAWQYGVVSRIVRTVDIVGSLGKEL